jgi:hypothetical protein
MYNGIEAVWFLLLGLPSWLLGIVAAQGWFSTFLAIIFPPYAWYLMVERLVLSLGW